MEIYISYICNTAPARITCHTDSAILLSGPDCRCLLNVEIVKPLLRCDRLSRGDLFNQFYDD